MPGEIIGANGDEKKTGSTSKAFAKNQAFVVEIFSGKLTIAPATTGVFIYLNIPRSLKNSIQYLAPLPIYATAGKALIAEDMALLQRLYLANAMATDGSPPTQYRIGHGG
jgi:hypothetical protein